MKIEIKEQKGKTIIIYNGKPFVNLEELNGARRESQYTPVEFSMRITNIHRNWFRYIIDIDIEVIIGKHHKVNLDSFLRCGNRNLIVNDLIQVKLNLMDYYRLKVGTEIHLCCYPLLGIVPGEPIPEYKLEVFNR